MQLYNLRDKDTLHTPAVIVHGRSQNTGSGYMQVQCNGFSNQYEVNGGNFKALVPLQRGQNVLRFDFQGDQLQVAVNYEKLANEPVKMFILVARDSPLLFDAPEFKPQNGIELAQAKFATATRMMQAFTNEQMQRAGFGGRTFNVDEDADGNVAVRVLTSSRTMAELRDPNIAQQNSKGTKTGELFSIALDELSRHGYNNSQCAVLYLDAHYDQKRDMILTHAALGGGNGNIQLAIFGSHGIWSWPSSIYEVSQCFLDTNRTPSYMANDCNECGSAWECCNITMGAFMHEIGHLLGCPHQEHGVMLRDYVTWNRSFMSREVYSTRTNSRGMAPILPRDECSWHRLDCLRFLHHKSFRLPQDEFHVQGEGKISCLPMGNRCASLQSGTGIYAVEIVIDDLARGYLEFLPKSLGGPGPQREVVVSLDDLYNRMDPKWRSHDFSLKVLAINGECEFHNFKDLVLVDGKELRSPLFGGKDRGSEVPVVRIDVNRVTGVRVYYGAALDGIRFFLKQENVPPPIPPRTYKEKILGAIGFNSSPSGESTLFGNETGTYADFMFEEGEQLLGFNVRAGAWMDAVQVVTTKGNVSPMLGGNGGGAGSLVPPSGFVITGIYGRMGQWMDAMGVIYSRR